MDKDKLLDELVAIKKLIMLQLINNGVNAKEVATALGIEAPILRFSGNTSPGNSGGKLI